VQKGEAPPRGASVILFYVTKPTAQIAGWADFIERRVGKSMDVWEEHGNECVLRSEREYKEFLGDWPRVSFIRFKNLRQAAHAMPLVEALKLLGKRRLSRKGFYVNKENTEKTIALLE
jgi:predicted transcriptional regulator